MRYFAEPLVQRRLRTYFDPPPAQAEVTPPTNKATGVSTANTEPEERLERLRALAQKRPVMKPK